MISELRSICVCKANSQTDFLIFKFLKAGSLMFDESSNTPVPIMGVTICPSTGKVLPVGGVKCTEHGNQPIIPYDTHTDSLSNLPIRVHSTYKSAGQVRLLNSSELFIL